MRIGIYLPPDLAAQAARLAARDGRALSTWLRDAALAAIRAGSVPPAADLPPRRRGRAAQLARQRAEAA